MSFKCTSILFSIDGLKKNISSYLLLLTFLYYLLSIILFIKCGFKLLIMKIQNIIEKKRKNKFNKMNSKKNENKNNKFRIKNKGFKKSVPPKKCDIKFVDSNEIENKRYHRVLRSNYNSFFKSQNINLFNREQNKIKTNENKRNK